MTSTEQGRTRSPEQAGQFRVGLLAAGAALLGAAIGAVAGFGGAIYQADSQRDLALRQEREAAYVQMNLAFNRFETAGTTAPGTLCARVDNLDEPYATVMLLGSGEASAHANFAIQSAQKACTSVKAGKAGTADIQGFTNSVVAFLAAAQKDLAR
ncbi:hypothetical protein AB0M83_27035 [Amycolatopsis sp. NPDC051106]|uniref:hypothetical protein n=1 Tax=unclassified Amycolatopsis TaxID=2618356 RepID=UPI00342332B2